MYTVVVNEGPAMADDNAVYFCPEPVRWQPVWVEAKDEAGERHGRMLVFAEFTPTNGHRKGKLHRVPWERVVALSYDTTAEAEGKA